MTWNKILYIAILGGGVLGSLSSCHSDMPDPSKTVITDPVKTAPTNFDHWLEESMRTPYQIDLQYRLRDNDTDLNYYLVPASLKSSKRFAVLLKYLGLEPYDVVTGSKDFIKETFPKIVQIIGSPAFNTNGTMSQGKAEGGYKIILYQINELDDLSGNLTSADETTRTSTLRFLNKAFFHTIHHEFTHIQNQRKLYSTEFGQITRTEYTSNNWSTAWDPRGRSGQDDFLARFSTPEIQNLRLVKQAEETIKLLGDKAPSTSVALYNKNKATWEKAKKNKALMEKLNTFIRLQDLFLSQQIVTNGSYNALQKGFITEYASKNQDEDFAEIQSTFLTTPPDIWNDFILLAGTTGGELINKKLRIISDYLQEQWGIDIVKLRDEILRRQAELHTINIDVIDAKQ